MSYKIAIASGKGGTGKTTVAINLLVAWQKAHGDNIELVDCDVEEPNDMIFFPDSLKESEEEILQHIPQINPDACTFCKACVEYCEFNAISVIPHVKFAEVNQSLCHSCGACLVACKYNAIIEKPYPIGKVSSFKTKTGYLIKEGRLKIGSMMQTMLIKELKKRVAQHTNIVLYDAPPGTSCPVVETISDTDYVILVAEPTLFGFYDLKLMIKLIREVNIPFGVIINKSGLGDSQVYNFLKKEGIQLLGEIPFSKEYAGLYAKGAIAEEAPVQVQEVYKNVVDKLSKEVMLYD